MILFQVFRDNTILPVFSGVVEEGENLKINRILSQEYIWPRFHEMFEDYGIDIIFELEKTDPYRRCYEAYKDERWCNVVDIWFNERLLRRREELGDFFSREPILLY